MNHCRNGNGRRRLSPEPSLQIAVLKSLSVLKSEIFRCFFSVLFCSKSRRGTGCRSHISNLNLKSKTTVGLAGRCESAWDRCNFENRRNASTISFP